MPQIILIIIGLIIGFYVLMAAAAVSIAGAVVWGACHLLAWAFSAEIESFQSGRELKRVKENLDRDRALGKEILKSKQQKERQEAKSTAKSVIRDCEYATKVVDAIDEQLVKKHMAEADDLDRSNEAEQRRAEKAFNNEKLDLAAKKTLWSEVDNETLFL